MCLNQRDVVFVCQHDSVAPVGVLVDLVVHADDEARDDAGGQHFVVILKGQRVLPVSGIGFFFGQQVGQ